MAEKLVTLTSYTYATEAYILLAKLESEGISHILNSRHLLANESMLFNSVGGLDVQVEEKDLEKARSVLKELEENKSPTDLLPDLEKHYEKAFTYCPECESSNVYHIKITLFSFGAKEHTCADCSHRWKQ